MADADRRGAVLILCVLLLLALALLAHGALLMAREDLAVANAGADLLRARVAAEAGIANVLLGDAPPPADTLGRVRSQELASGTLEGARYRVDGRRLSREVWLLEGVGAVRPDAWVARVAWPTWSMDPAARVASMRGVVEVGAGAVVSGRSGVRSRDDLPGEPPPDPVACAQWNRVRDSISAEPVLPPVALAEPMDGSDTAGLREPSLGLLGRDDLLAAASRSPAGTGTPGPAAGADGCLAAGAWNWGDPDDPMGACHGLLPLVGSAVPLVVRGGVGQGVLVVAGDLTLSNGARFYGLVLVAGKLTVTSGARLVGLARATGGLSVAPESGVYGSRCWAFQVLTAVRAAAATLARPRLLPGAGRVGPF